MMLSSIAKRRYHNIPTRDVAAALGQWTTNEKVKTFVDEYVKLMTPDRVHLCDGSEKETKLMVDDMVRAGTLIPLNPKKRPNSYLARSDPGDVARVEKQTLICLPKPEDVGPTNNWADPVATKKEMTDLYRGSMKGRTMYVVPYSMGPVGSLLSFNGIELTDSPYVVQSMRVMARMGDASRKDIEKRGDFVPGVHSVGQPLTSPSQPDSPWPANPNKRITHFPETNEILSYGSGYGGNALLGKKCFALRIAGYMAKKQGDSMAEHMLILCAKNKKTGKKKYIAGAFPSACGKTNFAMMTSTLPDYELETVGDDIAWMRFVNGRLHAINPEAGFFGVAPGTSISTNPNAIKSCEKDTIFTNVALTEDFDVWWEGMSKLTPGTRLTDWLRREWIAGENKTPAAHANSRFCAPAKNCPIMDPSWEDPAGVPIDAIIFGGRRSTTVPLIYQSRDWEHGTFLGATMGSEQTAAAEGTVGAFRPDPMAMIPFGSYNIGDYFQHWLNIGAKQGVQLPKIFFVNFFKKENGTGKFMWPGFGENSRLIKWVCERVDGNGKGKDTPIGILPEVGGEGGLDISGLNLDKKVVDELFKIDKKEWTTEIATYRKSLNSFGSRVPKKLFAQLDSLEKRIHNM
jgi:phosphoenolpyruvate carboxykinase (GTP)